MALSLYSTGDGHNAYIEIPCRKDYDWLFNQIIYFVREVIGQATEPKPANPEVLQTVITSLMTIL